MKNQAMLHAAVTGLAAVAADATMSFLSARQHVTQLTALDPAGSAGYVWRKVFLRGRRSM